MRILILLAAMALVPFGAKAEPVLKIINFTAEWCPNCQVLNPTIRNALLQFPEGQIEVVPLDMTFAGRRASDEQKFTQMRLDWLKPTRPDIYGSVMAV